MKFPGKVEENKLIMFAKETYENTLKKLNGKRVTFSIVEYKEVRNNRQNKYYWAILNYLEKYSETGYTKDEFHIMFKDKFLSTKHEILGGQYNEIVSTAKLNTKEFAGYIEEIRRFCNLEIGVYIPSADEIDMVLE